MEHRAATQTGEGVYAFVKATPFFKIPFQLGRF